MSGSERNGVSGSSFDGRKPRLRQKAAACSSERVHDQRPAEGHPRARDTAHERVLEESGADAPADVGLTSVA